MADIYIISDYGKLYKSNDTFKFHYPDGTVSTFFPHNTEKIIIIGRIEITSDALKMLMRHNIETLFVGRNGRFDGKLIFQEGKNVFIRQKQYRKLDDDNFKISICKNIVQGKVKNQLSFMQRIGRERKKTEKLTDSVDSVKRVIEKIDRVESVEKIRGYEGVASRFYFSVFRQNIIPDWAVFKGRKMNPPGDNVNAVMSFVYTLMSYSVETAIMAEGLDPYAGYLHSPEYGRKSLIFDLMEEYRVPICDTLTSSLFNLGILRENEFEDISFSDEDYENPLGKQDFTEEEEGPVLRRKGVLMNKNGLKKVIEQYEKKLESRYFYLPEQKQITFRRLIYEQVKHFKRVINGEESDYKPFVIK